MSEPGSQADAERRFGALRRLYGDAGYARLRAARVAVVGLGGVGSWAAEALARCGVAELVLIDLDQVAESNINRQVQALGRSIGQSKAQSLAERLADIHPSCKIAPVEEFVDVHNWPALLPGAIDALIDACDQVRAKAVMAAWALAQPGLHHVCVGAAGGRARAQDVEVEDLASVTHDALLASLRQRLRRDAAVVRSGRSGVRCVFSREAVAAGATPASAAPGMPLACHGYGSSVTVTATFGMVAAGEIIASIVRTGAKAQAEERPVASL
ncbi:MAG: ThiF family adenylyltransferase [Rubrivivax sp.]